MCKSTPSELYLCLSASSKKETHCDMKKLTLRKSLLYFIIGFVLFFLFRLGYGYRNQPEDVMSQYAVANESAREIQSKSNYATSKQYVVTGTPLPNSQAIGGQEQKYEKVCTADATTEDYHADEKKILSAIEELKGIIQYEKRYGLSPNRTLKLSIGVPQDNFDKMVEYVQQIGTIANLTIDKTDKTNDYNKLQASLASLSKTRDALIALKNQGGKIDEHINLEYKIMELEESIQNLGVNLGEFDSTNELCTVKFVLAERIKTQHTISFYHRLRVALEWTSKYYTLTLLGIALFSFSAWFIIKIYEFIQKIRG